MIKRYYKLGLSVLSLILTTGLLVMVLYGWYVTNEKASVDGIRATSSSGSVEIRDKMSVKRYLNNELVSEKEYHADTNSVYYEWDVTNSEFILNDGNKVPLGVASMFPYEYIDITMWYRSTYSGLSTYSIGITNMDDSEGTFTETINDVNYTHTALGVFRIGEVTLDSNNKEVVNNWYWLADYNGDTLEDTKYDVVTFKTGNFSNESSETIDGITYYKTTFRIQMNLTNYYVLKKTSTNMLSEKKVKIKEIRVMA